MLAVLVVLGCSSAGCRALQVYGEFPDQPVPGSNPQYPNPLSVPMIDRWMMMEQVGDELDNYFRLARQEPIRILDGIVSEGWIETHPQTGSTILEPWRKDSNPGFEKLHATLQTVRRYAKVRVIPEGSQYQIDVKVYKEIEDLPQPQGASVGGRLLRHDSSLDIDRDSIAPVSGSDGWIPMGRDFSLEQTILGNLEARVNRCLSSQ